MTTIVTTTTAIHSSSSSTCRSIMPPCSNSNAVQVRNRGEIMPIPVGKDSFDSRVLVRKRRHCRLLSSSSSTSSVTRQHTKMTIYPSSTNWMFLMMTVLVLSCCLTMTQAQEGLTSAPVSPPPPPVSTPAPVFPATRLPTVPVRTRVPTRQPTPRPTRNPTPRPTAVPTRRPTRRPTSRPTPQPTFGPTSRPTNGPTRVPTRRPTTRPTLSPSRGPSGQPSLRPSWEPSRGPSLQPTTLRPTVSPSASPSESPTNPPSVAPSPEPSVPPTSYPTTFTPKPTVTFRPTFSPSATPSAVPSRFPTMAPSVEPSEPPTAEPSVSPSAAPTRSQQIYEIRSVMFMSSVENNMDARAKIDWEGSTAAHIRNILASLPTEHPLMQLQVITDINSQVLLTPTSTDNNSRQRRRRRFLQQDEPPPEEEQPDVRVFPLQVEFLVRVTFRSAQNDFNMVEMIGEAFNSEEERQQYINRLQNLNADFDYLTKVEILVNGTAPREETLSAINDGDGDGGGSTVIIAVAAAGVILAVVALGFIVWRRMNNKNNNNGTGDGAHRLEDRTKAETDPTATVGYTAEILVERQDDVSTLGDPVFGMMTTHAGDRDEATASVGNDYDYSKQYLKAQGIASINTGDSTSRGRLTSTDSASKLSASTRTGVPPPSVFSDDASFEQQFSGSTDADLRLEVTVPAGKLGMVIDTPHGGVPVVHAIKPNSILANQVQVNDRLLSVDGEDVTAMTAVQVSKLISLKADQTRVLVFSRPQQGR